MPMLMDKQPHKALQKARACSSGRAKLVIVLALAHSRCDTCISMCNFLQFPWQDIHCASSAAVADLHRAAEAAYATALDRVMREIWDNEDPLLSRDECCTRAKRKVNLEQVRLLAPGVFTGIIHSVKKHLKHPDAETLPTAVAVGLAIAAGAPLSDKPDNELVDKIVNLMKVAKAPAERALEFCIAYLHGWRRRIGDPVWSRPRLALPWGAREDWTGVPIAAREILRAEIELSVLVAISYMAADPRSREEREELRRNSDSGHMIPHERVAGARVLGKNDKSYTDQIADLFLEKDGRGCDCWKRALHSDTARRLSYNTLLKRGKIRREGESYDIRNAVRAGADIDLKKLGNLEKAMYSCFRWHRLRAWDPSADKRPALGQFVQKAVKGYSGSPHEDA